MIALRSSYKKDRTPMYLPIGFYGIRFEVSETYQFPANHPCSGCSYTLNSTVPSCMFPEGGCIRYNEQKPERHVPKTERQLAAAKIQKCVEMLKEVQKRKGYR